MRESFDPCLPLLTLNCLFWFWVGPVYFYCYCLSLLTVFLYWPFLSSLPSLSISTLYSVLALSVFIDFVFLYWPCLSFLTLHFFNMTQCLSWLTLMSVFIDPFCLSLSTFIVFVNSVGQNFCRPKYVFHLFVFIYQ